MQTAAETATMKGDVIQHSGDVCIVPANVPGIGRWYRPYYLNLKNVGVVTFLPKSLTVVGGSAIQVYEYEHGTSLGRQTTDIDAVWWPKIHLPKKAYPELFTNNHPDYRKLEYSVLDSEEPFDGTTGIEYTFSTAIRGKTNANTKELITASKNMHYVVTSASPAIQYLISEYKNSLQKELTNFIHAYDAILKEIVGDSDVTIEAAVRYNNLFIAGICSIWGYIVIKKDGTVQNSAKLVEVSVHDGASSQITPDNSIAVASMDPVYSMRSSKNGEAAYSPIDLLGVKVPTVEHLLNQQLFALEKKAEKRDVLLPRCKFLYSLLADDKKEEFEKKFWALCTKEEYAALCESLTPPTPAPAPAPAPAPTPTTPTSHHYSSTISQPIQPGYVMTQGYAPQPGYVLMQGHPGYYAGPGYAAPYAGPGYATPYAGPGYAGPYAGPGYAAQGYTGYPVQYPGYMNHRVGPRYGPAQMHHAQGAHGAYGQRSRKKRTRKLGGKRTRSSQSRRR